MFVSVLNITQKLLPFFWASMSATDLADGRPCRLTCLPSEEQSQPLKVVAVCLPFVFLKEAHRHHHTPDVRHCRAAQVSSEFGKAFFEAARAQGPAAPYSIRPT